MWRRLLGTGGLREALVGLAAPVAAGAASCAASTAAGAAPQAAAWRPGLAQPSLLHLAAAAWREGMAAPAGARWASNSSQASGLKVYKPTTPGFRGRVTTLRTGLWKGRPERSLVQGLRRTGGRNNHGRVTAWHRGGGSKRLYRLVDFRAASGQPAVVRRLEYDPNRSARIALVGYAPETPGGKEKLAYVLAPNNVAPGDTLESGTAGVPIRPGNRMPLSAIPIGQAVHNLEIYPGKGGQMVRAAGTSATLIKKGEDGYAVVRLPSGEQRRLLARCYATIGALSNPAHKNRKLGKAGAARWAGRRPITRGMAMNPVDHPHGGGRGKRKGRISQTPWGIPTKGYRTRHNPRTDQYIRESRHAAKSGRR